MMAGGIPKASDKPHKCGAYTRRRGYNFERETVNGFREYGLTCRRVPLSGAGDEKGDVVVTASWGDEYRLELKRKKALPNWITGPLGTHDGLVMRADNGEALVVIPLHRLREWLQ